MFWTILHICSSYQGFRDGCLFLNLCGSSSFPHVDLGSTLVQDIAVLKQSGKKVVSATQDHRKALPGSASEARFGHPMPSPSKLCLHHGSVSPGPVALLLSL